MRNLISAVAFLISCTAAPADNSAVMFGYGSISCATWAAASQYDKDIIDGWILGVWTGSNRMNTTSHMVGENTDVQGILGEVRLFCAGHPADNVFHAVMETYDRMAGTATGRQ